MIASSLSQVVLLFPCTIDVPPGATIAQVIAGKSLDRGRHWTDYVSDETHGSFSYSGPLKCGCIDVPVGLTLEELPGYLAKIEIPGMKKHCLGNTLQFLFWILKAHPTEGTLCLEAVERNDMCPELQCELEQSRLNACAMGSESPITKKIFVVEDPS